MKAWFTGKHVIVQGIVKSARELLNASLIKNWVVPRKISPLFIIQGRDFYFFREGVRMKCLKLLKACHLH